MRRASFLGGYIKHNESGNGIEIRMDRYVKEILILKETKRGILYSQKGERDHQTRHLFTGFMKEFGLQEKAVEKAGVFLKVPRTLSKLEYFNIKNKD